MTRFALFTPALTLVATLGISSGAATAGCSDLDDPQAVAAWAEELRAKGPAGLAEVLRQCDEASKVVQTYAKLNVDPERLDNGGSAGQVIKQLKQLHAVADQVAGQRGASVSRLYWYTDLAAAQEAAALSGKPILSLRMLGKLTDELSCANSRYFRTALYSNKEVSDYLRDHYVLHWQSVRPVPRVTIDFGDGRKLERTVTGNSAHYVLDAAGRPLDVLPGLYGPQAFREWLERSHDFSQQLENVVEAQRPTRLASYHGDRLAAVDESLRNDLELFAPQLLVDPYESGLTAVIKQAESKPTALQAAGRAIAKTAAEEPLVAPFMPTDEALLAEDDVLWRRIAAARAADSKLDEASIEVIRRENPTALAAGVRAPSKYVVENPILRVVRNFGDAIALDTVKNEYLLHRQIHRWYVRGEAPADFDALNEMVYAELFLTPSSDPWLGLAPSDAYTALEGGGLTATP